MRGRGGLARAALEVHGRNNLEMLIPMSTRQVAPPGSARLVEVSPKLMKVSQGIRPPAVRSISGCGPLPSIDSWRRVAIIDADKLGGLARSRTGEAPCERRREQLDAVGLKLLESSRASPAIRVCIVEVVSTPAPAYTLSRPCGVRKRGY